MKIVAIIPARLASTRFPKKILFPFHGVPMIEHVRRRLAFCRGLDDVFVATCDEEVADVVRTQGGKVIMTSLAHRNGTERVVEALESVDCTHVMIVQGDELLILPDQIDFFARDIRENPDIPAWNAISPLSEMADLNNPAIVKCVCSALGQILFCFRKSPCTTAPDQQLPMVKKILGLMAFRKDFLKVWATLPQGPFECAESIEQCRILENGFELRAIPVERSYVSLNEPAEVELIQQAFDQDPIQKSLLARVIAYK